MSHYVHDTVIVVAFGYVMRGEAADVLAPDVEAFRDSLPGPWRQLVTGPARSVINDFEIWAFLPDGSGEGREESGRGDELRKSFIELFSFTYEDGSSPFEVIRARFGTSEEGWREVTVTRGPGAP